MTDTDTHQRPRPLGSLVAAAQRISDARVKRSHSEGWQDEGWDLYDQVGELRYVANTLSNATSKARLFAARLPTGDDEPEPINPNAEDEDISVNDRRAAETVQAIGGGALGRAELLRRLTVQLFVPGDGYLVGLPRSLLDRDPDEDPDDLSDVGADGGQVPLTELTWHALSVSEVTLRGSKLVLRVDDQERAVPAEQAILIRVWRPHPRKWWTADSPVKANLPVLRELVGLTKHVGASIDSRLAGAGLLVVGSSVEVMGSAAEDAEQPDESGEGQDDFIGSLIETMTTPIRDRDSAAAVVPMVIKVPDEAVDKVQHISMSTPLDEGAKELRDEAIRRLALGLDAPPEVLQGLGQTNHWSAWQVEESTVKLHIEPVLALICDALTTEFLWPVLEEARVPNARDYVVWFDTSDLTLRPNRAGEAQSLYEKGELSGSALRRESGFDENDAPEELDRATEVALQLVQQNAELMADPGLASLVEQIRQAILAGSQGEPTEPVEGEPGRGEEPAESGTELPDTQGEPPDEAEPGLAASLRVPAGAAPSPNGHDG